MIVSPHSGHSIPGKNSPNIKPQCGQNEVIKSISSITNLPSPNHSLLFLLSPILTTNLSL
jgi:hypothetical protein